MKALIPALIAGALCVFPLSADVLSVKEFGYFLDLPDGWQSVDSADPSRLSFTNERDGALLEVAMQNDDSSATAQDMERALQKQLSATGNGSRFVFSGRDSCLSQVDFVADNRPYRGVILAVKHIDISAKPPSISAVLVGFAPVEQYAGAQDDILSALDSFSPDDFGKELPGAISQSQFPFPAAEGGSVTASFCGQSVSLDVGKGDAQAAQNVVEREARLLATYDASHVAAWQRYYRMIYRDSYHRLDAVSAELEKVLEDQAVSQADAPLQILSWIQGFTFERTGTLSDFLSPVAVAESQAGDCDSRAILYAEILDHMGVDALIFVSPKFAHALGGVHLDRPGAQMTVNGESYLVAEMTAKVDIGLIDKDMADASAWIAMPLKE